MFSSVAVVNWLCHGRLHWMWMSLVIVPMSHSVLAGTNVRCRIKAILHQLLPVRKLYAIVALMAKRLT